MTDNLGHFLLPRDRVRLVVTKRLVGMAGDRVIPAGEVGMVINAPEQQSGALVKWSRYGDCAVPVRDLPHATFADLFPDRLRRFGGWLGKRLAKFADQLLTVALTAAVTVVVTLLVQHFLLGR